MLAMKSVLVIYAKCDCRESIAERIRQCGFHPVVCGSLTYAQTLLARYQFSAVVSSDSLPDGSLHDVMRAAKAAPVIVLSNRAESEVYLAAMRAGAFDYITLPADAAEFERMLWFAVKEPAHAAKANAAA